MSLADLAADVKPASARGPSCRPCRRGMSPDEAISDDDLPRDVPRSDQLERIEKSARTRASVPAGGTGDPTWAGPLATAAAMYAGKFIDALRPRTILGRLPYSPAPVNTLLPLFTSGADPAKWVGQGKTVPLDSQSRVCRRTTWTA